MDNKMLIDANHPEETRVVVVRGNRVEEFDFEAENKKQLRGNIYLAKVTRVEPSLQAAFVDYGGNRHGFLAFSEIHPDYYQIPVADRQALLEEEAEANKREDADDAEDDLKPKTRRKRSKVAKAENNSDDVIKSDPSDDPDKSSNDEDKLEASSDEGDNGDVDAAAEEAPEADDSETQAATSESDAASDEDEAGSDAEPAAEEIEAATETSDDDPDASPDVDATSEPVEADPEEASELSADAENIDAGNEEADAVEVKEEPRGRGRRRTKAQKAKDAAASEESADADADNDSNGDENGEDEEETIESVGSGDALEEVPERRSRSRAKTYKIQEVIKRRQIILVQVVKEERGNKGAALTTYLSLAGRYSVLMPNTDRGGGISRKITNQTDRKRLRTIASDLDVPEGMGVILRTAGASRTKTEIKRDFEYLMRLWENVRDFTLKSSAPKLVYEEGSLLKRSIRDLYNKDIKQVLVAGDDGYREAKDFMRMLMPSHAKNVQPYKDPSPIFARYGVEAQLDAMFSPEVTLKSGGYIVINQTEALVSIDVNSGRSTRERSIEGTALSTNLEAAEEVARQLRLRDLAGLVVIDFIDMEEKRNNRAVERKLKECLKSDRARIQVGRISHFGLLEMSRQRIRTGVLESTMEVCPHCQGTGYVRAPASVALYVLRAIEDYLIKGSKNHIIVRTRTAVALYVLNQKRANLSELEARFGLTITIEADETIGGDYCQIVRGERAENAKPQQMVTPETVNLEAELARDEELDAAAEAAEQELIASEEEEEAQQRRGKRRRRRRRSDEDADVEAASSDNDDDEVSASGEETDEDGPRKKRRRRGRRGGRRNRDREANGNGDVEAAQSADEDGTEATPAPDSEDAAPDDDTSDELEPVEAAATSDSDQASEAEEIATSDEASPLEEDSEPLEASDEAMLHRSSQSLRLQTLGHYRTLRQLLLAPAHQKYH
ncbi:MAG: Rne/Rng family ribonuclease, partial [Pseudomonadota bacterium]